MSEKTFLAIKKVLDEKEVFYETLEHEPVITSEDAAKVRGVLLHVGVKAMIIKHDNGFIMITLPADKKINFDKVKEQINTKKIRLATLEEVKEIIDCERGGVPPFGFLFGIQTFADKGIANNKEIEFNAGLTTKSIRMKEQDYFKVAEKFAEVTFGEFTR